MSLWKIAWRSIEQRALSSLLTAFSMALGVTLVVAVLVIHGVIGDSFRNNAALGYNMIVGAKGGKLQLVLNTVYYLSSPVENIPYSYYKEFSTGKFKAYGIDKAIPVCLGDYYQQFRVIGTTTEMFDDFEYAGGKKYTFAAGENFKAKNFFDAVIGATVARETGLTVGSQFAPTHGAADGHEHDPFTVVGILEPTGTPNDRGLFINIEGFYLLDDHAKPVPGGAAHAHDEHDHADHDHADHDHMDDDHDHAEQKPEADHDHDADHEKSEAADAKRAAAARPDHDEPGHDESAHDDHDHDAADPKAADHDHEEHPDHDHADHEHEMADHDHDEHGHDHAADGHTHGHHHHSHAPLPEEQREVTAVLIRTSNDLFVLGLKNIINEGSVAQAVLPILEITNLFHTIVDPLQYVLLGLTMMVVIVSGISILVSIYNSMSDRRHEIAVMRALGARRRTVMAIVLCESILLALGGGLLGWLLGHGVIAALGPKIAAETGVTVGFFQILSYPWSIMNGQYVLQVPYELLIVVGLSVLAAVVGFLPALSAYKTDVAKALSSTP